MKKHASPENIPTFFREFCRVREERLPTQLGIYEELMTYLSDLRQNDKKKIQGLLKKPLPLSTRSFYNCRFSEVNEMTQNLLRSTSIPLEFKKRAKSIYGFKLSSKAIVEDLLATDIFRTISVNLDFDVQKMIDGLTPEHCRSYEPRLHAYHNFLHGAQQTESIFFHEVAVGYFGNILQHEGKIPSRGQLSLQPVINLKSDYWTMPAYIIHLVAKILGRQDKEVAALHFVDTPYIRKALPQNILDVFLVSAHFYWHLDYFVKMNGVYPWRAGDLLNQIYHYFLIPSLEKIGASPTLRLCPKAGRVIEDTFYRTLLCSTLKIEPNHADVVKLLMSFSDKLWVNRSTKQKSSLRIAG